MKEFLYILFMSSVGFLCGLKERQAPLLEWGLSDMKGRRSCMEDSFMHDMIMLDSNKSYPCFALFDGHGGPEASRDAAVLLPQFLSQHIKRRLQRFPIEKALPKALSDTCTQLDEMLQKTYINQGTTALITLVAEGKTYLAWVGDSRAIIFSDTGSIKYVTVDHKPTTQSELKRIGAQNIIITSLIQNADGYRWQMYRTLNSPLFLNPDQKFLMDSPARLGGLSLSRALGDYSCKKSEPLIIAAPDIHVTPVSSGDYIILACDGLWDVISSEDAVALVSKLLKNSLKELQVRYSTEASSEKTSRDEGSSEKLRLIARVLRDKAYDLKSSDNISVMIIKL
jgi:serine/threonine protein phosphatase PrpC